MQVHAVKICGFMLQKMHAGYLCIYPCIAMIIAYVRFLIPLVSSKFYTKKILFKKMVSNFLQITLINIEKKNMYPYINLLCYISTCSSLHSLILKKNHEAIYFFTLLYIYLFQLPSHVPLRAFISAVTFTFSSSISCNFFSNSSSYSFCISTISASNSSFSFLRVS